VTCAREPSGAPCWRPLPSSWPACSGGGAHDIEKLLADLTGESPGARSRAERTLAEHGRSVIKPLSSLVTLKDAEKTAKDYKLRKDPAALRTAAARALGVIAARASLARSEAETAAAPLLEALKGKDLALRIEAARALGFFTQLSAPASDLILTFREDQPGLVDSATEALARNALRSVYLLAPPPEPPQPRRRKTGLACSNASAARTTISGSTRCANWPPPPRASRGPRRSSSSAWRRTRAATSVTPPSATASSSSRALRPPASPTSSRSSSPCPSPRTTTAAWCSWLPGSCASAARPGRQVPRTRGAATRKAEERLFTSAESGLDAGSRSDAH